MEHGHHGARIATASAGTASPQLSRQLARIKEAVPHDGDCAAGRYCAAHGLNANTCDATKAICATCGSDSQCGSLATCKGLIGFQKCIVENALSMGATCCMDAQCKTNRCEKDRCVCRQDDDCPRGQKCKTPITGQNHCE